jgi:hypothetical protein
VEIDTLLYENSINALNILQAKRLAFLNHIRKAHMSSSLSAPGGLEVLS